MGVQMLSMRHMDTSMRRWERLERYSRWKQGRLDVNRLPCDVMSVVMGFLSDLDVEVLVEACVPDSLRNAVQVPPSWRPRWVASIGGSRLRSHVRTVGLEKALPYLDHDTSCQVIADWSQFSSCSPVPVATFSWVDQRIRITVNEDEVRRLANGLVHDMIPVTRLGLHMSNTSRDNRSLLCSEPLFACLLQMFPYELLNLLGEYNRKR